ncbi:hypothetical protein OPKNFCMD_2632 [Methylobacterium crusticola]|uniref:DUF4399 domain-containing protein n=1 Tax=Methylobacterium crusticola TaxID=1697972 RepID=A0ABQ4QZ23_9HYPH|nr:DUF4399 domain-containing protein [Methylobacterium crusticola]GJD49896.1 hypothetical protein OPKNFCMD_2632 [Methylobacterium crusticola]
MIKLTAAGCGLCVLLAAAPAHAQAPADPAPPPIVAPPADATVYFISPTNGARLKSPVVVRFGLRNMGVTQAGSPARNAGHHHLVVDAGTPAASAPIPADTNHLHFGGGQTETKLDLEPGRHTLQLVLGDALHRPFSPSVASDKITITVVSASHRARKHRRHRNRR